MVYLAMAVAFSDYAGAIAPNVAYISPTDSYVSGLTTVTIMPDEVSAFATAYTLNGSDPILSCAASLCVAGDNTTIYSLPFDIDSDDTSFVTLKVISSDADGALSDISTYVYYFDKTFPVVAGVLEGVVYDRPLTPSIFDTNLSSVTLNNNFFTSGMTILSDGMYTLIATDLAGNNTVVHFTVTLDTIAPVISGVVEGAVYDEPVVVDVSDDNLSTVTLNDEVFIPGSTISTDDSYELVAMDTAGNTTTVHFTVAQPVVLTPDPIQTPTPEPIQTPIPESIVTPVTTVNAAPTPVVTVQDSVESVVSTGNYYNDYSSTEAEAAVLGIEQDKSSTNTLSTVVVDTKKNDVAPKANKSIELWVLLLIPLLLLVIIISYWLFARDKDEE
jgi:hypothetical protein